MRVATGMTVALLIGLAPTAAIATHERAALITWAPTSGNAVEFTVTGAWRRSAYTTANGRCRDVMDTVSPVLESKPCSGGDTFADVGDVIVESLGGTVFNPGEGATIGSPLGALLYVVTSIDPANDWLFATALDPVSLPSVDTTIAKTYPDATARTAFIQDCCRVSNNPGGNQHINNPDGNYRIETRVTPGGANRPPVSTMPPIVLCPRNGVCVFQIPGADPDNDTVTFRLSTATEASGSASGFDQPGPPDAPNAATVSSGGVFTWNTTGAALGGAGNTYYSTQVSIEDRDGGNLVKSKIAVDFLIQLVQQAGVPPVFDHPPTPVCGSTINVNPGDTVSFTVQGSDVDFGQTVTLNGVGLPAGATMTPTLPTTANPVSSAFAWTTDGGDAGTTQVMTFTATDSASLQAQCSVTLTVNQCQTNADCNDGTLCTTDTCDPGNPNASAGGCVNAAISCDACQVCDPGLGCAGSVCTPINTPTNPATPSSTPTSTGTPTATVTPTVTATRTLTQTVTETPTPTPACGNGALDSGEDCDDGNAFAGDGCEADCNVSDECTDPHSGTGSERFVGACGSPSLATIQAAIDASSDGDTVLVCPGTYTDPIVLTREITLRAWDDPLVMDDAAVTTIHTAATAIDVRRSGVTVRGLTIIADSGVAIDSSVICPLGQASCDAPGHGSNLTILENRIRLSPVGVRWRQRIDCARVKANTIEDTGLAVDLDQQGGTPAVLVTVELNVIRRGGSSGQLVRVRGVGASVEGNDITNSVTSGVVIEGVPVGAPAQFVENRVLDNADDGIVVRAGGEETTIENNNIVGNGVGLANEAPGAIVDATDNWWGSQKGPFHASDSSTSLGDEVQERLGAVDTDFVEFLCAPAPRGFSSSDGVCSVLEPEDVQFVALGRAPDVSPNGRFVTFVSDRNDNGDQGIAIDNMDGGDEVFVLNRKPGGRPQSRCLGGAAAFDDLQGEQTLCSRPQICVGDPDVDPVIPDGSCILVTQISHDPSGNGDVGPPRVTLKGDVLFAGSANLLGGNADGSDEVYWWKRGEFRRQSPNDPNLVSEAITSAAADSNAPAVSGNGNYVVFESKGNPLGQNDDGNREIFVRDAKRENLLQLTHTDGATENLRPSTVSGKQVLFDSNADIVGTNGDGNRELFLATFKAGVWSTAQLTFTAAPAETRAGAVAKRGKVKVFSSTANFTGANADGNPEIFVLKGQDFEQITNTPVGTENVMPHANPSGRYVVFESTANLPLAERAGNRRVFRFDLQLGQLVRISNSSFGDNFSPRISKGRFVVWESTSNLGLNPGGNRAIYVYDRRAPDPNN